MKPKNDPEKTLEGDLKKMELTWGTAESEAKDRNIWRKRNGCIILMGRSNKRRRYFVSSKSKF